MAFAVKYRCEFTTLKGRYVKVDIEKDGYGGSVIDLIAATDQPLLISYPNGEFDKFVTIKESRMDMLVLNRGVAASDFLTTSDNEYKVKVYINNVIEWQGWLDNDKLEQPFVDTDTTIRLTANDGLELIKNKPYADSSGNQVWSIQQIKEFIGNCLNKTELGLQWVSFINTYPAGYDQRGVNADYDAFYYINIMSHTFLINTKDFDDCYSVLSKIMEAFCCTLMQARGKWYIVKPN